MPHYSAAFVLLLGFFFLLGGIALQRGRQAWQDRRSARQRLDNETRRVGREAAWVAGVALFLYVAYKVVEHGPRH